MTERTTGYSLIIIGIIIMIFATIQIISVFTGRANPISFFQYEEKSSSNSNLDVNSLLNQLQKSSEVSGLNIDSTPNFQLFDPKLINQILNLAVYYLIMQFLLSLGFKFASLGVQLVRPIHVNMKNRLLESSKNNNTTQT